MTTTKPPPTHVAPPPAYRSLRLAVAVTVLIGLAVAVATLLRFDAVLATAQAASPSATRSALAGRLWSRIGIAGAVAVMWPLLLRRLGRGSARVYARLRRVSAVAAALLVVVALVGSAPVWLHLAHGVQAATELGIFAVTLHPDLRAWHAAHRAPRPNRGA